MSRTAQGEFIPKNPQKYVGAKRIRYRSSWELTFMNFCDTHSSIQKWASEAIRIPYKCPFTNRITVYVPDFFIQYADKHGMLHVELIEVKPLSQTIKEKVGRSKNNQYQYIKNQAKWQAAQAYCKHQGIKFRIITENDIFHVGKN